MNDESIRLSKLMSQKGICSRREADKFIEKGWVKVNDEWIDQLGYRCDPNAEITLHENAKVSQNQKLTILFNKPLGFHSGPIDKQHPSIIELITFPNKDKKCPLPFQKLLSDKKLAIAGRLDINSKGLIVLTQDGRVAKQLIEEDSAIEKEYLVRFQGSFDEEKHALLENGLTLDERTLKPAKVDLLNNTLLRFTLKEGRKRQIRRMCEEVELTVLELIRVRIGNITLSNLSEGRWRYLKPDECF